MTPGRRQSNLQARDINAVKNIRSTMARSRSSAGEIGTQILWPDGTGFRNRRDCNVKGRLTDPNACLVYEPKAETGI